jgi:hypothetical protein
MPQDVMTKRRVLQVAVILACVAIGALMAEATSWDVLGPFDWSEHYFQPTTVGLPVGSEAPPSGEQDWVGFRTALIVTPGGFDYNLTPILESWGEIEGLRVILAPEEMMLDSLRDLRHGLGAGVVVLSNADSSAIQKAFHLGELASNVTFLIDESGTIVHRHTLLSFRSIGELDRIVRAFAATDEVPEGTITEHVLGRGDLVPWPDFQLEGVGGGEVRLEPGPVRLLFSGEYVEGEQAAIVLRALDELRGEFPDVEFVWHCPYLDEAGYEDVWTAARACDLEGRFESPGLRSLDEYLAEEATSTAAWKVGVSVLAQSVAAGWTVLFDPGYRLQRWWLIYGEPTVMIIGGEGEVLFPCSFFLADLSSGEPVLHPAAVGTLRSVLAGALEDTADED